jgi:hypothetical protein
MGIVNAFIVGRSFISIIKSRGHRIDFWGTLYFIIPQLEPSPRLIFSKEKVKKNVTYFTTTHTYYSTF